MAGNNLSDLDADQVIRSVYDEPSNSLKTTATISGGGGLEVVISHTDDSIAIGTDTDLFTSTTVGPKIGLDSNIINTDLDIRDLTSVSDSVSSVVTSSVLPTGAATEATLATRLADSTFTGRINTQGQKAMAASTPVVIASDQSTLGVRETGFATVTQTGPTVNNVSSTILASNTARRYAIIYNQSGSTIFLSFNATAAVANTGIRLPNNSSYEITSDNLFTGAVNAIKVGGAGVVIDVMEGT